jgi:hypothetical protein
VPNGVSVEHTRAVSLHVGGLHGDLVVEVHHAAGCRPVERHENGQLVETGCEEAPVGVHGHPLTRGWVKDNHPVGGGIRLRYLAELAPQGL